MITDEPRKAPTSASPPARSSHVGPKMCSAFKAAGTRLAAACCSTIGAPNSWQSQIPNG